VDLGCGSELVVVVVEEEEEEEDVAAIALLLLLLLLLVTHALVSGIHARASCSNVYTTSTMYSPGTIQPTHRNGRGNK
jgi:hypothetical protein